MDSNIVRYLFDTNAIRGLNYAVIERRRNANTALETTSDILYELGGRAPNKVGLLNISKMNASAYQKIPELLGQYPSVRTLLDYYNNKGVGDVGIIAYALTADEGKLLKERTIVVTQDAGLSVACKELGIEHISPDEFSSLV